MLGFIPYAIALSRVTISVAGEEGAVAQDVLRNLFVPAVAMCILHQVITPGHGQDWAKPSEQQ